MALILWAIDVPHVPLQRDAIMRIGANPLKEDKVWIVVWNSTAWKRNY